MFTNNVNLIGRLTADVTVFENKDGSQKVKFTVACKHDYKSADNSIGAEFIPVEAFVPAGKDLGVYALMHKGDLVGIDASIRNNNYEKDGTKVYDLVLRVDGVTLLEGKAVTSARQMAAAATEA